MNSHLAKELKNDSDKVKLYSDKLFKIIQVELINDRVNKSQYSELISLITCLNLTAEKINYELSCYVIERQKRIIRPSLDMRV